MRTIFAHLFIAASLLGSVSVASAAPMLYQNEKDLTGFDNPATRHPVNVDDPMIRENRVKIFVPSFDLQQKTIDEQASQH
jgi:hypothetical protein